MLGDRANVIRMGDGRTQKRDRLWKRARRNAKASHDPGGPTKGVQSSRDPPPVVASADEFLAFRASANATSA